MCDFCKKIVDIEEVVSKNPLYWNTGLVKEKDNSISLICRVDDYYYSGTYLDHLQYCPYCGREFNETDEVT